jgi:hypothetical protein
MRRDKLLSSVADLKAKLDMRWDRTRASSLSAPITTRPRR